MKFEDVKTWLEENAQDAEVQKYFQVISDKRVTSAIQTYRDNHFKDELAKMFAEKKEELAEKEKELTRKSIVTELRESAITKALSEGINPVVAIKMVGIDESGNPFNDLNLLLEEKSKFIDAGYRRMLRDNAVNLKSGDEKVRYNTLEKYAETIRTNPDLYDSETYKKIAEGTE